LGAVHELDETSLLKKIRRRAKQEGRRSRPVRKEGRNGPAFPTASYSKEYWLRE